MQIIKDISRCQQTAENTVTVALFCLNWTKILLLQKSLPPHEWELLGGHAQDDEEPTICARREITEETGLQINDLQFVGISPYTRNGVQKTNWIYYVLLPCELSIKVSTEHQAAMWELTENALSLQLASKHSAILSAIVHECCNETFQDKC